jgi:hypothetical protein
MEAFKPPSMPSENKIKLCNDLVNPTPTLPEVIKSTKFIHHLKRYKDETEKKKSLNSSTYNKFTKSRVS